MEGFLWLLLQMTLLLLAAAVVFLLLGWRWRSQNAEREMEAHNARLDDDSATLRTLQEQRDVAITNDRNLRAKLAKAEADLEEANGHRSNLERELIRVHEDLKAARGHSWQPSEDNSALQAAQDHLRLVQQELEQLQREMENLRSEASAIPSEPPESSATEKPKRTRKTGTSSFKSSKHAADAEATLSHLEAGITEQQALIDTLQQEQDARQHETGRLSEEGTDPAELELAMESLKNGEAQVAEAQAQLESLQRQSQALHRSLEQAAGITQEDDLTKIKGIKGVLSQQLHAYGIRTFQQIADWTEADVKAFSLLLSLKDRTKCDHWVQQAQELGKALL
jgi:predicted flap endonuclease-1-like 5' DNA nuclease